MELKRIAIMGTGSLGTILGAYIAKSGRQIDLIDANKAHVDALNETGATVVGTVSEKVPVTALTPDQMEGNYDLFIYMAKQTYNDKAIPQMKAHLSPGGVICTCQNGIPEPAVAAAIGEEHTFGCTVGWGATWLAPGVSEATTLQERWYFHLGSMTGKTTEELLQVKEILELMCRTDLDDNLMGARWSKLLANCTFSGMSACLGCTFGEVMDHPVGLKCVTYLARECVRVTLAQGYRMNAVTLIDNKPYNEVFEFHNEEERKQVEDSVRIIWAAHRASKASMLQDLEKGLPCEIDAINGVLSNTGKKLGIPTPVSDKVVEIVHGIQDGKLKYEMKNIDLFTKFE